jgi:hypothetical protein
MLDKETSMPYNVHNMDKPDPSTRIHFDHPMAKNKSDTKTTIERTTCVEVDGKNYEVMYFLTLTMEEGGNHNTFVSEVYIDQIPAVDETLDTDLDDDEWAKREDNRDRVYDEVERALCDHYMVQPKYGTNTL